MIECSFNSVLPLHGLALALVKTKQLSADIALQYQQQAQMQQQSFMHYLLNQQLLTAKQIAQTFATHLQLPFFDLTQLDLETIPYDAIPPVLIQQHRLLPLFKRDQQLFLATDDPSPERALQALSFHTPLLIKWMVVETDQLQHALQRIFRKLTYTATLPAENDETVVQWVNQLLTEAMKKQASDVHFEPYESFYRIRYRLDGLLEEVAHPPLALANRITARLKVLAQLDPTERRLPQDGRFHLNNNNNQLVECRVSSCPTTFGEKVAVRLLDLNRLRHDLDNLGLTTCQKNAFLQAIHRPLGLVIVTGPTGSGKSVTLYQALTLLNKKEINICSVEDPVEIKIPGVNQVNVHPKTGLGFSTVLRAFLRQDPDVIMIGEIRDQETAQIAVSAAQTGHLVLSTLHTNDALAILSRLSSLGIAAYHLATSLCFMMAQRLVRTLCEHCKRPQQVDSSQLLALGFTAAELPDIQLYEPKGCIHCTQGYQGRTGLFEVIAMDPTLEQLILNAAPLKTMRTYLHQQGSMTLHRAGLEKIKAGLTTIEELNRVAIESS